MDSLSCVQLSSGNTRWLCHRFSVINRKERIAFFFVFVFVMNDWKLKRVVGVAVVMVDKWTKGEQIKHRKESIVGKPWR